MDIYIQSCGKTESQDYRWLEILVNDQFVENPQRRKPPFMESSIKTRGNTIQFGNLYEVDNPALVLARNEDRLILLVYWLNAKTSSLEYRRPIYNSIALVASKNSNDENLRLQMLASDALNNWKLFAEKVGSYVKLDAVNTHGFKVEIQQLKSYIDSFAVSISLNDPDKKRKLAKDVLNLDSKSPIKKKIVEETKQLRIRRLAQELKESSLPIWNGPLVVVAENVSEEVLNSSVWRGISDCVEQENNGEDWKEIIEQQKKNLMIPKGILIIILSVLLLSFFVAITLIVLPRLIPDYPTPQESPPVINHTSLTPTPQVGVNIA